MKLAKSFEQGVCIMAILAIQERGTPVGSFVFPKMLGMSATYSQKILRKLVVAGLVKSVSGNNGGFSLAKPASEISVLRIVEALEGKVDTFPDTGLINKVFDDNDSGIVSKADEILHDVFHEADQKWRDHLASVSMADIFEKMTGQCQLPAVNWNISTEKRDLWVAKILKGRK